MVMKMGKRSFVISIIFLIMTIFFLSSIELEAKRYKKKRRKKTVDIWEKKTNTMQYGGVDIFYTFYQPEHEFIKEQYPNISGLGATFHFPIWTMFTIYNKFTYIGLFNNEMEKLPEDYKSASFTQVYFSQGVRIHILFYDLFNIKFLRNTFDIYGQIGWNACRISEFAATEKLSAAYNYSSLGYEYGGGLKIMVTNNVGFFGESIFTENEAGKNNEEINSVQINFGIFVGFIGNWLKN
jgi:hypothetical protein